jgi:tyrosine decarboxylase / aspartate 1-decarboxylase
MAKKKTAARDGAAESRTRGGANLLIAAELDAFADASRILRDGFADLPGFASEVPGSVDLGKVLAQTARRLHNNYPYFHPLYAGQMLKPPHPVAQLAYVLAMSINPNNHALDGGRATSAMEKEAVAQLAAMFGWKTFLGHLCGGGTMANLEALWVASQAAQGKTIVASEQAHYTHERISKVLQLPFEKVKCDAQGRMDVEALKERLLQGEVATVVVTLGTTATGAVDPLHEILKLRAKQNFRIHSDAAYGGYFALVENLDANARKALAAAGESDSIAIDPHKHGLQPYGCGCVLFKDPAVGRWYRHNSPYTYFSSNDLHLGEISLECSRPGAAAAALWATQKLLPLVKGGEFARSLAKGREAASALYSRVSADDRFVTSLVPELDVVIFGLRAETVSAASSLARDLFDAAAKRDLHLALVELPVNLLENGLRGMQKDRDVITCLRSALMKPEHLEWVDRIWEILLAVVEEMGRIARRR